MTNQPIDHYGKAYNKCIRVINSCLDPAHLEVACRMIRNYSNIFGHQTWTSRDLIDRLENKSRFFYYKFYHEGELRAKKSCKKASCRKDCK
jgi:hypothetical protein